LLTGTYPWVHRAIHANGTAAKDLIGNHIFQDFAERGYTSLGFSHNQLVNVLLHQFRGHITEIVPPSVTSMVENAYADELFSKDYPVAIQSERSYLEPVGEMPNSLFMHFLIKLTRNREERNAARNLRELFPRGLPKTHDITYRLEDTFVWLARALDDLTKPFLAYIHVMPPHNPYTPRREFVDIFDDGWAPAPKPEHFFKENHDQEYLANKRREYDEYIAYVDAEFGRLVANLDANGLLEDTVVVITSDHGEMFERGIFRHLTPTLYEPLLRVPLLIAMPGQQTGHTIHTLTSSVDLLPTLVRLSGGEAPAWSQGAILPPFDGADTSSDRQVFAMEASRSSKRGPHKIGSSAIISGEYKLIHYFGYHGHDKVSELYNLAEDPEERRDLAWLEAKLAKELEAELIAVLGESYPVDG
jgi:arylsulfatase A-like enzyme